MLDKKSPLTGNMIPIEGQDHSRPQARSNSLANIAAALAVFSLFYLISAYFKPFHVDEFYSWVYAQRCTFKEILLFRDGGIGHPPLYHLLQKMVMEIAPGYHFLLVRVVNYFAGALFVILLVKMLCRYSNHALFSVATTSSAAMLNVFVFSRMWGLVCLSSLLLLLAGERYIDTRQKRFLPAIAGVCIIGYLSDYVFVLMMPYVFLVLTLRHYSFNSLKVMYGGLLSFLLLTAGLKVWTGPSAGSTIAYDLVAAYVLSIPRICFEAANTIVNFWFFEPFIIALSMILGALYLGRSRARGKPDSTPMIMAFVMIMVLIEIFIRLTPFIQVRYSGLLVPLVVPFAWRSLSRADIWDISRLPDRLIHSIAGGMIMLLTVSPFFWRNLLDSRFLTLFLPLFFLWILLQFNNKAINLLSVVLILSGMVYVSSRGIAENFPPPVMANSDKYIYQDLSSYATQYLKTYPDGSQDPVFLDVSAVYRFCRVCAMGSRVEGLDSGGPFFILGREDYFDFPGMEILDGLILLEKRIVGLSFSDRIQFEYFRPIRKWRHAVFKFQAQTGNEENKVIGLNNNLKRVNGGLRQ